MDPLYVQNYSPDTRIWTSIVAGYVQSDLAQPGLSYVLPQWQVPGAFQLSVQNAELQGNDLNIGLSVQAMH